MMPSFDMVEATDGETNYQFRPLITMDQFGSIPLTVDQLQNGTSNAKPEPLSGMVYDGNTRQTNSPLSVFVPLFGRLRFLRDPYGIASLLFIVFYWMFGSWSTLAVVLIPQYREGRVMAPLIAFYVFISILTLVTLLKAATTNPGMVPFPVEEPPVRNDPSVGYCEKCRKRKPARAHHCSRCHQCVQRMDHHCQWINNCVGEGNHYLFVLLIVYTFALSLLTLMLGCMQLFFFSPCRICSQESFVTRHSQALVIASTVMGGLMAMSSMGLLISQSISLMLDQTTIEIMQISHDWMVKGPHVMKHMPQPKSCLNAFRDLCGSRPLRIWLFPCGRRLPRKPADPYAI